MSTRKLAFKLTKFEIVNISTTNLAFTLLLFFAKKQIKKPKTYHI